MWVSLAQSVSCVAGHARTILESIINLVRMMESGAPVEYMPTTRGPTPEMTQNLHAMINYTSQNELK